MCDLCSPVPEEQTAAIQETRRNALILQRMADRLNDLAAGRIQPHSPDAKHMVSLARSIIYYLVTEWM
jgi:uncharacterized protein YifE (UPF0438 family)